MDFFLGTLGFLQMTLLPGLIAYRFFKVQTRSFDTILIVFGLSLIANYIIVFLMAFLGIYTSGALRVLVLAEVAAMIWYFRDRLNTSINELLDSSRESINRTLNFFFPDREENGISVLQYFIGIVLLLLAARSILWGVNIFIQNLGTVFSAWDAVVSWNRWATVWASNHIPLDSGFYPQLVPLNWSVTYVMLGSPTLQFFAKGLMPVFGVLMLVGLLNLCIQMRQSHFLISVVVLQILLKNFLDSGMSDGYVDIAVAFFTFAALYILIRARDAAHIEQSNRLYILGALFSAGAAITKQTGVYIALCYPVLAVVNLLSSKSLLDKNQRVRLLSAYALISLLWVSWYAFKALRLYMGVDRGIVDVYVSLSADKYESASVLQQVITAIGQYPEFIVLFILVVLTFPWMDRFYKALTILFAPYPIIWAWLASYDTRNLAIFLPVLALISGYSIQKILDVLVLLGEKSNIQRTRAYIPLALVLIGVISLSLVFSSQKLEQQQADLQKQIFSPSKNKLLYELIETNGPDTKILTNYPMSFLPGLEQNQVAFDFSDFDQFVVHVNNPQIDYIFLPNAARDQVKNYIDQRVDSGDYELIVRDKQWKTYTLIRIINHN